jgi:hypothetical protein
MRPRHPRPQSKKLSEAEKRRRAEQRQQAIAASVERLLFSRQQTRHALGGTSLASIIRLEDQGLLTKVRLAAGTRSGMVFHYAWQVRALALAQGGGNA